MLNRAASDSTDEEVELFVHSVHQGVSGLQINKDLSPDGYRAPYIIKTNNWEKLIESAIPYYVKIDIEDNETKFLDGMAGSASLPEFISVECHALEPVEALFSMGYRRFRLIDQNAPAGLILPRRQYEGRHIEKHNFHHASGPFGLDVFEVGGWIDFEEFRSAWRNAQVARIHTWFDCHAWEPKFALNAGRKSFLSNIKRVADSMMRKTAP